MEPCSATERSRSMRSRPPRVSPPIAICSDPCSSSRLFALRRRAVMLSPDDRDHHGPVGKAYPLLVAAIAARRSQIGHADLLAQAKKKVVLPLQVAHVAFGQRAEM